MKTLMSLLLLLFTSISFYGQDTLTYYVTENGKETTKEKAEEVLEDEDGDN